LATPTTENTALPDARSPHGAAGWLALAASPTFTLMAWIAAGTASPIHYCSAAPAALPINGMAVMYLLMSLFHLAPWLRLASGCLRGTHLTANKETDHGPCHRFTRRVA